jgi:hypothetical protein
MDLGEDAAEVTLPLLSDLRSSLGFFEVCGGLDLVGGGLGFLDAWGLDLVGGGLACFNVGGGVGLVDADGLGLVADVGTCPTEGVTSMPMAGDAAAAAFLVD